MNAHAHRFVTRITRGLALTWLVTLPALAATVIPPSFDTLANSSVGAVEARVSAVRSGVDPETSRLATYVELDVSDVLFGLDASVTSVVLREPGGTIGDRTLVIEAAPLYEVGQRVLVFLDPARDGALRTQAMALGAFVLNGEGADATLQPSDISLDRVAAPATLSAARSSIDTARSSVEHVNRRFWFLTPPELSRVVWTDPTDGGVRPESDVANGAWVAEHIDPDTDRPNYKPLSESAPTRWTQPDSGQSVPWVLAPNGYAGGAAAAQQAIELAMNAWNELPAARVELTLSDASYDWTNQVGASPTAGLAGVNGILFGDPYDDVPDMVNCSGTLAIGGYWRSSAIASSVNGIDFHPALQGYIVFNNGFECFADTVDDVAEIATHEFGHAIGFGHSTVSGAIMRSSAYGNRGAVLSADDRDAAHCTYPHTLSWTYPAPGDTLNIGTDVELQWNSSSDVAVEGASTLIEVSFDSGTTWSDVTRTDDPAHAHTWTVPDQPTSQLRMRLSRAREGSDGPAEVPEACTISTLAGDANVAAISLLAGRIPSDGLTLTKQSGLTDVTLSWASSCSGSSDATDYAVYSGDLSMLRDGFYNHQPENCSVAGQTFSSTSTGDRYYLIAPLAGDAEGDLGVDAAGALRPTSGVACAPRETSSTCPTS